MVKKKNRGIHFAPIFQEVVKKKEWRSLSHSAQLIYIYIKLGYTGKNNGGITLPYSTLTDMFSSSTIAKALRELVDKDWIEVIFHGGLFRNSSKYKLTLRYDRVFKV